MIVHVISYVYEYQRINPAYRSPHSVNCSLRSSHTSGKNTGVGKTLLSQLLSHYLGREDKFASSSLTQKSGLLY